MNRRLSIAGSREGYAPFHATAVTATEITEQGLIGPFTRAQIVALWWRVKEWRIVAEVNVTTEREVYNEATDKYDLIPGSYTKSVNMVAQIILPQEESGTVDTLISDEDYPAYRIGQPYRFAFFRNFPADELKSAGVRFAGSYDIKVSETGGFYLEIGRFARVTTDDSFVSTLWESAGTYGISDGINTLDFDADFEFMGETFNLPMQIYTAADDGSYNVSIDSASLTVTVEKWRPYATTAGAPAYNATTGAPANGGPGA